MFGDLRLDTSHFPLFECHLTIPMQDNLHSPQRLLIELRMEHADLDNLIDRAGEQATVDELTLRRLKKRRLLLRDQISQLEMMLDPKEPA